MGSEKPSESKKIRKKSMVYHHFPHQKLVMFGLPEGGAGEAWALFGASQQL